MASQNSRPRTRRWPRRLYDTGSEPDPRFTLANERTFLAWLRTALALMAGGVGIAALNASHLASRHASWSFLTVVLLADGVLCSAAAFGRWVAVERALRTGEPLPPPRLAPILGYTIAALGVAACVLLLVSGF